MALVVPPRVPAWFGLTDRQKLILFAAIAFNGDRTVEQIRREVRCRKDSVLKELEALRNAGVMEHDPGVHSSYRKDRRNGRVVSVSAALSGGKWTAIPEAKYAHLTTTQARFEFVREQVGNHL